MSDKAYIENAIEVAKDNIHNIQHEAAHKLLAYDGEHYPTDGCAITLSTILQDAGIEIDDTYQAFELGNILKQRGWTHIPVGKQQKGDVGSTCGRAPNHGHDHVFFVVDVLNHDEMVIADNQAPKPHFRFASGHGKTPTKFFLRAV